jgi:hypothetical protein
LARQCRTTSRVHPDFCRSAAVCADAVAVIASNGRRDNATKRDIDAPINVIKFSGARFVPSPLWVMEPAQLRRFRTVHFYHGLEHAAHHETHSGRAV